MTRRDWEGGLHALGVFLNGDEISERTPDGRADPRRLLHRAALTPTTSRSSSCSRRAASGCAGSSSSRPWSPASTGARDAGRRASRCRSSRARSSSCGVPSRAVLAVAAVVLLAACGSKHKHAHAQAPAPAVARRLRPRRARYEDRPLRAAARRGARLRARPGSCSRTRATSTCAGGCPSPGRWREQDARVLLWDYGNAEPDAEVAAAARELRRLGSTRIVLAGASEGAKAAIVAAARAHARRSRRALVALSPEAALGGQAVAPSARELIAAGPLRRVRGRPVLGAGHAGPRARRRVGAEAARRRAGRRARRRAPPRRARGHRRRGRARLRAGARPAAAPAEPELGVRRRRRSTVPADRLHRRRRRGAHRRRPRLGDTAVVLAHEYPRSALRLVPVRVGARPRRLPRARVRLAEQRHEARPGRGRRGRRGSRARREASRRDRRVDGRRGDAPRRRPRLLPRLRPRERLRRDRPARVRRGRAAALRGALGAEDRRAAPRRRLEGRPADHADPGADAPRPRRVAAERAVLVDGSDHGWNLLQGPSSNARIRAAVLDFLRGAGEPIPTGCAA